MMRPMKKKAVGGKNDLILAQLIIVSSRKVGKCYTYEMRNKTSHTAETGTAVSKKMQTLVVKEWGACTTKVTVIQKGNGNIATRQNKNCLGPNKQALRW